MAGQRVQIKATRQCLASVPRFMRHWGSSPLTALVIHCKGNRRCKSPPSEPPHSPNCPPVTGPGHQRGWCLEGEGPQEEQQGRRGPLGESGMVGVGGRGTTQGAKPLSYAPIKEQRTSLALIAFWPPGAPPGCFPWDGCCRRSRLHAHGQLGGLCTFSRFVRCCAPHTGQSLLPAAGSEAQHQNHWWLQVPPAKVKCKVPTQFGTWRCRNS